MNFSFFFSKSFLLSRPFLWLLFITNALGTVYGYIWYDSQLRWTVETKASWMIPFVPDSPTASLFFTLALLYLLFPPPVHRGFIKWSRSIIEALAVVCSVKYGIWATVIIIWGAIEGDTLNWQSYMLMTSHLAMAFEALLYLRFFKVMKSTLVIAFGWLLLNDTMDYTHEIYPWLPSVLHHKVTNVKWFTYTLSCISFIIPFFMIFKKKSS